MRAIFASERCCISNMIGMKWKRPLTVEPTVLCEVNASPENHNANRQFNCDFSLDFVDRRAADYPHAATAVSVLPNTIGVELFLVVRKDTLAPMLLELIGGGALSIHHFERYLDKIDIGIRQALPSLEHFRGAGPMHESINTSIRSAAYVRLLVVGSDVTFLFFPKETTPTMRGKSLTLVQGDDRQIDCYIDGDGIVCFDGWMRGRHCRRPRLGTDSPRLRGLTNWRGKAQ